MATDYLKKISRIPFPAVCLIDAAFYLAAGAVSRTAVYPLAGLILAVLALFHFCYAAERAGSLITLEGIFMLSWIGGQALAQLRLSLLQNIWSWRMWGLLFLTVVCFFTAARLRGKLRGGREISCGKPEADKPLPAAVSLGRAAVLITVFSLISLLIEYLRLGFLPITSPWPHAYFYFHVKGFHYITVSAIYVPALAVLYRSRKKAEGLGRSGLDKAVMVCCVAAVMVPIVLVSRYQLFYAAFFAVVCYVITGNRLSPRGIALLFLAAVLGYAVLTVLRHHDVEYLNGIFEPRYPKMPIFITQPYMYIVNNYENLNCLVEKLETHAHGVRSFMPFFSLTGLKNRMPWILELPVFKTKSELSTLTVFYDSYYDFGPAGSAVLAFILGWFGSFVQSLSGTDENPACLLLYGQVAVYYVLSFFMPWTSDLSVWFGLFVTLLVYLYVERGMRHAGKNN